MGGAGVRVSYCANCGFLPRSETGTDGGCLWCSQLEDDERERVGDGAGGDGGDGGDGGGYYSGGDDDDTGPYGQVWSHSWVQTWDNGGAAHLLFGGDDDYDENIRLQAMMGGDVLVGAEDVELAAPLAPDGAAEMGSCPVCMDTAAEVPSVRRAHGCGHLFCGPCIERWLGGSVACPVCKNDVTAGGGGGRRAMADRAAPAPSSASAFAALTGDQAATAEHGFHHLGMMLQILATALRPAEGDGAAGDEGGASATT